METIKECSQNLLGNEFRRIRRSKGLTQAQVAALAELCIPAVRHLEHGRGNLNTLACVLKALDCELKGRNLPAGDSLGNQVARLRKRRRVSQRTLARQVGVTQPTIIAIEKRNRGRLATLERVLSVLGAGPALFPAGESPAFYTHAGNSSVHEAWETPVWLLERLYAVFGTFDLDPCSATHDRRTARVRAKVYFTQADDGLSVPWHGRVFVNPPYGRALRFWTRKARTEVELGNAEVVVCLVPARTDTGWWHEDVAGKATVFFLRGRLSFGDGTQPAPFPSALLVWGAQDQSLAELRAALPEAWVS